MDTTDLRTRLHGEEQKHKNVAYVFLSLTLVLILLSANSTMHATTQTEELLQWMFGLPSVLYLLAIYDWLPIVRIPDHLRQYNLITFTSLALAGALLHLFYSFA